MSKDLATQWSLMALPSEATMQKFEDELRKESVYVKHLKLYLHTV